MQSRSTDQCSLTSDMRGSMVTRGNLLLLLLCAVPSPGLGGHGFPHFSVFRCSYHFRFFYLHPFTEALCIDNSLSLQRFPSILPLMLKLSISLFLITCPMKLICLTRIVFI